MASLANEPWPVRKRRTTLSSELYRQPPPLPRFQIDIPAPDLSDWFRGSDGVPGVITRKGPTPGPHLVLVALTHGNEYAGAIVLDQLLRSGFTPPSGQVSVVFANLDAFARFNPSNPTASRFVEEDLNRLWSPAILASNHRSRELTRARQLEPIITSADLLLDLHTMLWAGTPLLLAPNLAESMDFARASGGGMTGVDLLVTLHNYRAGARLIEHPRFGPGGGGHACLLEAGQHWSQASVTVTDAVLRQTLRRTEGLPPTRPPAPRTAFVTDKIFAESSHFSFTEAYPSGTIIERRGTVVARDGMDDILTPYNQCILVLPNHRPAYGHLAVRMAKLG